MALDGAGHRSLTDGMAAYELSTRAALLQPDVAEYRSQLETLLSLETFISNRMKGPIEGTRVVPTTVPQ